jgi:hypothetical protein
MLQPGGNMSMSMSSQASTRRCHFAYHCRFLLCPISIFFACYIHLAITRFDSPLLIPLTTIAFGYKRCPYASIAKDKVPMPTDLVCRYLIIMSLPPPHVKIMHKRGTRKIFVKMETTPKVRCCSQI